jgi:hypothetical protein
MNRKQRLLLTLGLVVACVGAPVSTTLAAGAQSARESGTGDRASAERTPAPAETDALAGVVPKPRGGKVVCPGIILKVGPTLMLPCRRGPEIVKARSVEVDGRYCARVTYIAEAGSPPRTEIVCEGDRVGLSG